MPFTHSHHEVTSGWQTISRASSHCLHRGHWVMLEMSKNTRIRLSSSVNKENARVSSHWFYWTVMFKLRPHLPLCSSLSAKAGPCSQLWTSHYKRWRTETLHLFKPRLYWVSKPREWHVVSSRQHRWGQMSQSVSLIVGVTFWSLASRSAQSDSYR